MSRTIKAQFESRQVAEMAVEHLVTRHGIDRNAVRISIEAEANTAGNRVAVADMDGGGARKGKNTVWATVEEAQQKAVIATYATFNGSGVRP